MMEWVIVDDTDSSITYTSGWFSETGNLDTIGMLGPPFLSTVHGTKGEASFSVSFTGSQFNIIGSLEVDRTLNSVNTTWQCVVDDTPIAIDNAPTQAGNHQSFCGEISVPDGPHHIVVNAVGTSQQTFWFDFLQYIPSANASLTDSTTMVEFTSSQIQYGPAWVPVSDNSGTMTNLMNSNFSYAFEGIGLTLYGLYDSTLPSGESTATYSIDGGTPTAFNLNGTSGNGKSVFNQIFFSIHGLSPGAHMLEVVNNGNTSVTPLTVQTIARFAKASTTSDMSSVSESPANPTSSSSSPDSGSSTHSGTSSLQPVPSSFSSTTSFSSVSRNGSTLTLTQFSTISTHVSGTAMSATFTPSISAPTSTSSASHQRGHTSATRKISIIVIPIAAVFLLLLTVGLVCLRRRKMHKKKDNSRPVPFFSRSTNGNDTLTGMRNDSKASLFPPERSTFYGTVQEKGGNRVTGRAAQPDLPIMPEEHEVSPLQTLVGSVAPPAYIPI